MAPPDEDVSAGSILRELIFNQYQAIVARRRRAGLGRSRSTRCRCSSGWAPSWCCCRCSTRVRCAASSRGASAKSRAPRPPPTARGVIAALDAATRQALRGDGAAVPPDRGQLPEPDRHLAGLPVRAARQARHDPQGCLHRLMALQRYEKMPASRNPARHRATRSRRSSRSCGRPDLNERAPRGAARRTSSSSGGCWRRSSRGRAAR